MAGNVDVTIGCNYEDFLRGLANVKKEADLAVLEQRKKDQAEREARRAAAREERNERRAAEREKQEAARKEKKESEAAWRETQRQAREKEKAEKEAQKAAEKEKQKKFGIAQGFIGGGVTGGISAIGAAFGPEGQIVAELVNKLIEGFQKAVQEAKELRNLSYATDISTGELRKMTVVAEQAGISISQFAHSVAEFNKNMGRAKIGGSELNNLLNKLGVSQEDIKNNSYDYNRALRDLAKAHRAGTDAATLAYYGNLMFGSSFEQLLPLIKRGTGELDRAGQGIYQTSELANQELSNMSDRWDKFWANVKNISAEGFAFIIELANSFANLPQIPAAIALAKTDPKAAAKYINEEIEGGPKTREFYGRTVANSLKGYEKIDFLNELNKQIYGEAGKKLTPVGLQTAQGASSLQQMGGGDIVSAAAFSPAQATAENTAKSAEELSKIRYMAEEQSRKIGIRNAPRR